jgi:hypothetical protein
MEEANRGCERVIPCKLLEILLDGTIPFVSISDENRTPACLGRDAAWIDKARNIITFPVLQEKRCRWDKGVSHDAPFPERNAPLMSIVP